MTSGTCEHRVNRPGTPWVAASGAWHTDAVDESLPRVRLGAPFIEAVAWANGLHARQARKGTDLPYVSHLVSVSALVLEDGGDETEAGQAIDVLLAFDDEDRIIGSASAQFEQPVGQLAEALDAPRPASLAVRAALAEVLGLVAHHLEDRRSGLVAVIVGGDDAPSRLRPALRLDRKPELRGEPFGRLANGEAGVLADEVEDAAAGLVLVVVPLAPLVAGDLDCERSVAAVAPLRARRQGAVGLAQQRARHILDPLLEPAGDLGEGRRRAAGAQGPGVIEVNQGSPGRARRA